ncbi:MAG: hypothetical protein GY729_16800 [Desulfobacteraceae bacterium]|nr:hypothetical protein [Desulfobacteraceae bacterium]
MFDALSVGDNDAVRAQFKTLEEKVSHLKVYVYDFNGKISFSTQLPLVGKDIRTMVSEKAQKDLNQMLETGIDSGKSFQISHNGDNSLVSSDVIFNEERCYHCHGSKKKILGGISVFSSDAFVTSSIEKGRNTSILIGVAGLFLIIGFVWFFFHFIVNKKIFLVLEATSRLREKDFSKETTIGPGDEINHILARINLVTQNLRETIQQVITESNNIFNSSKALNDISNGLMTTSTDATQKAVTVSAAAEEMSINNSAIATAMEESTESLNATASAVEELSATVSEISQNVSSSKQLTQQVAEEFDSIVNVVDELGKRANDVDLVTDEIRSISEHVSLLALNAKIEAARAGDAGKGFAVVAQEITELAVETSNSTLEADEKLRWIKEKSEEVTSKVSRITQTVNDSDQAITSIASAVEEQNASTREIAKSINAISSEISQVNTRVTEGASVASEIAKDMAMLEEGARDVQDNSSKVNENADSLSGIAKQFLAMMKAFKV